MRWLFRETGPAPGIPEQCKGFSREEADARLGSLVDKGLLPPESGVCGSLEGWFHQNYIVRTNGAEKVLVRIPKPAEAWAFGAQVRDGEFARSGIPTGGRWDRGVAEEAEAVEHLYRAGVQVIPPESFGDGFAIYPYFPAGVNYDVLLGRGWERRTALRAVSAFFGGILDAHERGFVLGDRWGPNERLLPDGRIIFFDHDSGLGREHADFELAQALYYTSRHAGRGGFDWQFGREVGRLAAAELRKRRRAAKYDLPLVGRIAEAHVRMYSYKDPLPTQEICDSALAYLGKGLG